MLPVSNAEKLVHAFMTSRLDYCNALIGGCPASSINKLQIVQNAAARVLAKLAQTVNRTSQQTWDVLRTSPDIPRMSPDVLRTSPDVLRTPQVRPFARSSVILLTSKEPYTKKPFRVRFGDLLLLAGISPPGHSKCFVRLFGDHLLFPVDDL